MGRGRVMQGGVKQGGVGWGGAGVAGRGCRPEPPTARGLRRAGGGEMGQRGGKGPSGTAHYGVGGFGVGV